MDDAWGAEVDAQMRRMSAGFGVEIVLAFPVLSAGLALPVIASAGSHDRAAITPTRAFRHAIRVGALGVVLGHNHPSDTGPSRADHALTRRLVAVGVVIGVPLLAHVVSEPSGWHEIVEGRTWKRPALKTT